MFFRRKTAKLTWPTNTRNNVNIALSEVNLTFLKGDWIIYAAARKFSVRANYGMVVSKAWKLGHSLREVQRQLVALCAT